jgi:hypothetical protein
MEPAGMSFSSTAGVKPAHRTLVHGSDSGVDALSGLRVRDFPADFQLIFQLFL